MYGTTNAGGGIGYPFPVRAIYGLQGAQNITVAWEDPTDTEWVGTKLVRQVGRYPRGQGDGTVIVDTRVRDQYAVGGFVDTDLVAGLTYYYQAFPYASYGANTAAQNRVPPIRYLGGGWSYNGSHSSRVVTVDGVERTLLTLIGSGVLTLDSDIMIGDVWMCGGGSDGYSGGGAGAFAEEVRGMNLRGGPVVVGARQADTSFQGITALGVYRSADGGTGGGRSGRATPGKGDGKSKIPFGLAALFDRHCAGGGGAGVGGQNPALVEEPNARHGGIGGSNGGNASMGSTGASGQLVVGNGALGGERGGGKGRSGDGYSTTVAATNASFYGSGGGGNNGLGYQGVVYILFDSVVGKSAA